MDKDFLKENQKLILFGFCICVIIFIGIGIAISVHQYQISVKKLEPIETAAQSFKLDRHMKTTFKEKKFYDMDTYNMLSQVLYNYYNAINEANYETSYSMLHKEYIENNNYTLETYSKEMKEKYTLEISFTINQYILKDNVYTCRVEYYESQVGEEGVREEKTYYEKVKIYLDESTYVIYPVESL